MSICDDVAAHHRDGRERPISGRTIVSARIEADDVVEKGFKTLLDPSGNQMEVLALMA